MSYDIFTRLSNCDHTQTGERYVVDSYDFRTLHLAANPAINMRAPINGQAQFKLYISGKLVDSNHPVYGYDIVRDENRVLTSDVFFKVVFKRPVRAYVPLIELRYITTKPFCVKCSGHGTINDYKQANSGGLVHTVGVNKLVQKSMKFVLTSQCPFYPQFTCPLKDYIGRKFSITITEADVSSQVTLALENLKNIQSVQRTVQTLTPQETLKDITSVVTTVVDPTSLSVAIALASYGSVNSIPVNFTLTSTRELVG